MSSLRDTDQFRPSLSVLDLVHVPSHASTADAVASSVSLASLADQLGYHRYWIAEHHNMPAVASTSPPVLTGIIASATKRIRVGSGAVLLPNHSPFLVAEQFALLEAAFPGRIDLGIGGARGTDASSHGAMGQGSGGLDDLLDYVGNDAPSLTPGRPSATPKSTSHPCVWLLGASEKSARSAAQRGLPYVFGHHLGVAGIGSALSVYRSEFQPSRHAAVPTTLIPVRAAVAETYEEAYSSALPWLLVMLGLHTGRPQFPVPTIEEAEDMVLSTGDRRTIDALSENFVIGDPDHAARHLAQLAENYSVDEIMIHPISGSHSASDPRSTPAQETTLRLLAQK